MSVGDDLKFINAETGEKFARAKIAVVSKKTFANIMPADFETHEKYKSKTEMLETYRRYYGKKVNENSLVKIITFKLLK